MSDIDIASTVARLRRAGACPLGAAIFTIYTTWGNPWPTEAAKTLDIRHSTARKIADLWDASGDYRRHEYRRALRLAIDAGLGPRILAGLALIEAAR